MVGVEEIQEEFADLDIEVTEDDVLLKLKEYCDKYNIDANKISCEYFSFNTKSGAGRAPSLDLLEQFEHDNLRHLKVSGTRRPLDPIEGVDNLPEPADMTPTKKLTAVNKRNLTPETIVNKRFVSAVGSPSVHSQPNSPSLEISTQAGARYADRKNKGEIVLQHNQEAPGDWTPSAGVEMSIERSAGTLSAPYRYMFNSLRERAAVLDELICKGTDLITTRLDNNDLMDIRMTQVEPQLAVGRICCDSEGRLNSNSVILQASMDTSAGAVLPLDLSKLESFSLFPGQIVGLECTNPNGSRLQVSALHPEPLPPLAPSPTQDQVIEMVVSCGPYTPQDSDSIQPLTDILACIQQDEPHVAVFIGPFVDAKNSALDAMTDMTYQQYFEHIVKKIYASLETTKTQVILVPSQRDVHEHPVYPQPPANIGNPDLWEGKLHSMPDPAVFTVNGLSVGVTASDILFHLGKEEIHFPPRSGDRFTRLASHLLSQRCFYPLYPPNLEQNLDLEHLETHGALGEVAPHLVITPSDLQYFVRDLPESSTFINPGRITKGFGPGTYAKLSIKSQQGKVSTKAQVKRI